MQFITKEVCYYHTAISQVRHNSALQFVRRSFLKFTLLFYQGISTFTVDTFSTVGNEQMYLEKRIEKCQICVQICKKNHFLLIP